MIPTSRSFYEWHASLRARRNAEAAVQQAEAGVEAARNILASAESAIDQARELLADAEDRLNSAQIELADTQKVVRTARKAVEEMRI
jgi:archaellum component FlaC